MSHPVPAILEGGPADLPAEHRSMLVTPDTVKVKVGHLGGYEHFERDDCSSAVPVVLGWTMRTKIAE